MSDDLKPLPAVHGHEVTFTERPDILVTAECEGLTLSWLKGDDDETRTEKQKMEAAALLVADVERRANGAPKEA